MLKPGVNNYIVGIKKKKMEIKWNIYTFHQNTHVSRLCYYAVASIILLALFARFLEQKLFFYIKYYNMCNQLSTIAQKL